MLRRLSAAVATIREDHAREDQTWKSCTGDGAGDWIQGHKGAWGRAANMRSSSKVNKVLAPSEAGPFVLPEKGLVLKGPRRSCIPLTVSFSVTVLPEATPELKKPWTALVKVPVAGVVAN